MDYAASNALHSVITLRNKIRSSQMNEILPFLYLGSLSDSLSLEQLESNNIKAIVTIREDAKPRDSHSKLRVHFVQLCDQPAEKISAYFKEVAIFIHDSRIRKEAVLVHCLAGVSRSATIVAAYLMIVCNLTSYNALSYITARRPKINPNFGFRMQLCKFENAGAMRDREDLIEHFGADLFEKQFVLDQIETKEKYITQCDTYLAVSKPSLTQTTSADTSTIRPRTDLISPLTESS